jgi:hypothetical protein
VSDIDSRRTVVLLALAAGASRAAAAGKAGITDRTLRRWIVAEPDFAESVDIALGAGRAVYEELLREAAGRDWRAAAFLYEALYIGRSKTGPTEDAPPAVGLAVPERTPEEIEERRRQVMLILVKALGQEGAERVLATRAEWIARDSGAA